MELKIKYLVLEVENDRGQTRFIQAEDEHDVEFYSEEDALIWIKNQRSTMLFKWYTIVTLYK
jgi:hypothetical protein